MKKRVEITTQKLRKGMENIKEKFRDLNRSMSSANITSRRI